MSSAFCEGGALAAVVVFLLTGSALVLAPYALSWLGLAAHFPGDRHWARLTGLAGGAARNAPSPWRRTQTEEEDEEVRLQALRDER